MTQEEKLLLLRDLCARLPYKVMVCVNNDRKPLPLKGITFEKKSKIFNTPSRYACEIGGGAYSHIYVKPYLRPMSSMTKEELKEYHKTFFYHERYDNEHKTGQNCSITFETYDWLNVHHFDYRTIYDEDKKKYMSMIEKGLAIEAPEGIYGLNKK